MRVINDLFDMGGGYVLFFSARTFLCVRDSVFESAVCLVNVEGVVTL